MAAINRSKPKYVKLNRMAPATHDHNIVVKVLEKETVVNKDRPDGSKVREENVTIADETGCMILNARNNICDDLAIGETVALHNAKVRLVGGHMSLAFDKWGSVNKTTIAIPGEACRDPNFSEILYNKVAE